MKKIIAYCTAKPSIGSWLDHDDYFKLDIVPKKFISEIPSTVTVYRIDVLRADNFYNVVSVAKLAKTSLVNVKHELAILDEHRAMLINLIYLIESDLI